MNIEEIRQKLWCDAFIAKLNQNPSLLSTATDAANYAVNCFDKLFLGNKK